jgi:hypothetical protein
MILTEPAPKMLDKLQLFLYVKKNVTGKVAQKAKMTNIFQLTVGRTFPLGTISKASFPFFFYGCDSDYSCRMAADSRSDARLVF